MCQWGIKTTVLVVAVVGTSGSGKTTVIEYLISHFSSEGYSIGAIKHIHHDNFSIDRENTNTWRYAHAGSKVVVAIAPHEIDIIKKTERELKDLDKILGLLEKEKLDVVLIEGFHGLIAKRKDIPKIITAKDQAELQRTLQGTLPPIIAASGVVANKDGESAFEEIPLIRIPHEGRKLIKLIEVRLENHQHI